MAKGTGGRRSRSLDARNSGFFPAALVSTRWFMVCMPRPAYLDLSPKFPPVRSRVLGCRHAHRDGVSRFGRAAFLRSLIAAPFASQKMLFVRPEAPLSVPAHAR